MLQVLCLEGSFRVLSLKHHVLFLSLRLRLLFHLWVLNCPSNSPQSISCKFPIGYWSNIACGLFGLQCIAVIMREGKRGKRRWRIKLGSIIFTTTLKISCITVFFPNILHDCTQCFAVRSLGWVEMSEEDLASGKSSVAVNNCIRQLSYHKHNLHDTAGIWGEVRGCYWLVQTLIVISVLTTLI